MSETGQDEQLRKTKIAFWINLLICTLSIIVLFYSLETGETWRIVAASLGFLVFLTFAWLVFRRMRSLDTTKPQD
ncbi:MAG: hypothetical protein GVX96_02920 [Bacteroidetes bacterium]|jgi:hypothetical protein|nr:hypothetical protein [Bacteroidota bacterium]